MYKTYLNKTVKQLQKLEAVDWVYVDKHHVDARRQTEKTSNDNPSVKLRLKKMGPYKVIRTMDIL